MVALRPRPRRRRANSACRARETGHDVRGERADQGACGGEGLGLGGADRRFGALRRCDRRQAGRLHRRLGRRPESTMGATTPWACGGSRMRCRRREPPRRRSGAVRSTRRSASPHPDGRDVLFAGKVDGTLVLAAAGRHRVRVRSGVHARGVRRHRSARCRRRQSTPRPPRKDRAFATAAAPSQSSWRPRLSTVA